jgi:hypothetical protein
VSSLGLVRTTAHVVMRRNGRPLTIPGRMKWPQERGGYLSVQLHDGGRKQHHLVHRLVALAFLGEPPEPGMEVNHRDGNRSHNRATNLEWVTRSENITHAFENDLFGPRHGEHAHHAKLTEADVLEMRRLRSKDRTPYRELGSRFGVSHKGARMACLGITWGHLPNPCTT